ncbi:5-formyltetrahydrofolate cyclo-ligase [Paenibacillus sp. HN-1]|uniref:5-formyltetrahydrofolate cyclo-ligase n=1 Tax=Paenibacillus TaxID=44249 RepID=UPI001CA8EAC3|nr:MULTISPECIES: 5-formyltetrahydrofolate cyclo-ligase [Paenibacillus]MBY9081256.1 5-formyltetrahydrofolate cyclo-ligase [Paenibacillus sp. CGMCC 1.18879]MBY9087529.1 5-formyltetrahydrofolate cyclo-ligase [Paenibacillus sinensis]
MTDCNLRLAASKRELRAAAGAARGTLSVLDRQERSALACRHAWNFVETAGAESVMAYAPIRSELDVRPLIESCWQTGRNVILPRVHSDTGTLSLHPTGSWHELVQGTYGIFEPAADSPELDEDVRPAVIFVPGLAFDLRGGRLGYGRGYYDRLLARLKAGDNGGTGEASTVWIGLAYAAQLIPEVPMDAHDAFMDFLITEDGIVDCRRKERDGG